MLNSFHTEPRLGVPVFADGAALDPVLSPVLSNLLSRLDAAQCHVVDSAFAINNPVLKLNFKNMMHLLEGKLRTRAACSIKRTGKLERRRTAKLRERSCITWVILPLNFARQTGMMAQSFGHCSELSVCFFLIHCLLNVLVLFFVSSACCHSGSAKTPKNLVARHGFGVLPVVEQARYGKGLHFATSLQFKIVLFIVVPDPDGNNTENTRDRRGGVLLPPLRHKREF